MLRNTLGAVIIITAVVLLGLGMAPAAFAADAPPNYQLQYLGPGTPAAINNNGVVVGARLSGNNYTPLVSVNGAPWAALPVPTGAMSTFPTDVNDSGVIVGVSYDTGWNPVAVRWTPSAGTYPAVDILPRLPGDASSYATGINNLGQIVGARRALGYTPTGSGWLYSEALGVVDLAAQYGWWTWPGAINDGGLILGGAEWLDLNTGTVTWIGNGPSNYQAITGVAINSSGMVAGQAAQNSTSLNIVSVFRYEGASGWRFIAGTSKYTTAQSINNLGDIGYGELGAGLYLEGLGVYALGSLLDPAVIAAGWNITGSGVKINDQRVVAAVGSNSTTGQSGGVLLTPVGVLSPPTAPANLQGVAHPATRMEPYNAINLTWENTSALTRGYDLQRRQVGTPDWTSLSLTPPGTATQHTDTTVGVGIAYEYRVSAVGLSGNSPWSNVVTVTSPSTPLDTTPPVVTISTPANGAAVSGAVTVSAQATDNVAVEYLEISFWNQYTGQEVILGSVANAGALTVNWNTSGLTPAAYAVHAYAYDTLGNWTRTEITVNVTAGLAKPQGHQYCPERYNSRKHGQHHRRCVRQGWQRSFGLECRRRDPVEPSWRRHAHGNRHDQYFRARQVHGIRRTRRLHLDRYRCDEGGLCLRRRRQCSVQEYHQIARNAASAYRRNDEPSSAARQAAAPLSGRGGDHSFGCLRPVAPNGHLRYARAASDDPFAFPGVAVSLATMSRGKRTYMTDRRPFDLDAYLVLHLSDAEMQALARRIRENMRDPASLGCYLRRASWASSLRCFRLPSGAAADFTGGLATRRSTPFHVLALSSLSGIVILVGCVLLTRESFPSRAQQFVGGAGRGIRRGGDRGPLSRAFAGSRGHRRADGRGHQRGACRSLSRRSPRACKRQPGWPASCSL